MNLEQRSDPRLVGFNYSHYPELDHSPAFAWCGQQGTENGSHHVSSDRESVQTRQLSYEEDDFNVSEDQRSMTR